jgi:hypothetical protein
MNWTYWHSLAQEADLWTSLVINVWLLLGAAALLISRAVGRRWTETDVLLYAIIVVPGYVFMAAFVGYIYGGVTLRIAEYFFGSLSDWWALGIVLATGAVVMSLGRFFDRET